MKKDSEMTDEEFNADIVKQVMSMAARINVRRGQQKRAERGDVVDYAELGRLSAEKRWGKKEDSE